MDLWTDPTVSPVSSYIIQHTQISVFSELMFRFGRISVFKHILNTNYFPQGKKPKNISLREDSIEMEQP